MHLLDWTSDRTRGKTKRRDSCYHSLTVRLETRRKRRRKEGERERVVTCAFYIQMLVQLETKHDDGADFLEKSVNNTKAPAGNLPLLYAIRLCYLTLLKFSFSLLFLFRFVKTNRLKNTLYRTSPLTEECRFGLDLRQKMAFADVLRDMRLTLES